MRKVFRNRAESSNSLSPEVWRELLIWTKVNGKPNLITLGGGTPASRKKIHRQYQGQMKYKYQHELWMLTFGKGTAEGGGGLFHFCQFIGGVNWAQTFLTQSFKLIALRIYPLLFSASLWYVPAGASHPGQYGGWPEDIFWSMMKSTLSCWLNSFDASPPSKLFWNIHNSMRTWALNLIPVSNLAYNQRTGMMPGFCQKTTTMSHFKSNHQMLWGATNLLMRKHKWEALWKDLCEFLSDISIRESKVAKTVLIGARLK